MKYDNKITQWFDITKFLTSNEMNVKITSKEQLKAIFTKANITLLDYHYDQINWQVKFPVNLNDKYMISQINAVIREYAWEYKNNFIPQNYFN